jgi:CheY-like chemotaxis protein
MGKHRIAIIDDSETVLAISKKVLESAGYTVFATSSLVEFDRIIQAEKPDLILTDINMPDIQGDKICETLKNEHFTADIPIVLFSSIDEPELKAIAEKVQADGYILKDRGPRYLVEQVNNLINAILW